MVDVSYLDAVGQWWHGNLNPNSALWGIPIFAWERIGKLMGLFGGLTVILDIVGAPAVRRFGKKLRDWITFEEATRTMFYSIVYAVDHIVVVNEIVYGSSKLATKLYLSKNSSKREQEVQKMKTWLCWDSRQQRLWEIGRKSETLTGYFVLLISLIAIFVSIAFAFEHWSGLEAVMFLGMLLAAYTFFAIFVLDWLLKIFWPSAAATVLVFSSVLAMIVDAVIDRIADVLEHPKNDTLLRSAGVILFLFGFHFDLLGS